MAYSCEKYKVPALTIEEMETLIDGLKLYRYNSLSIGAAMGIRAAFRALSELGADRNNREIELATVNSGYCFAQAVEFICAVPHLRGRMNFTPSDDYDNTTLEAKTKEKQVFIHMNNLPFASIEEVLSADDNALFQAVTVTEI
ncbi:MAG: hypothetical protein E7328_05350 [Clostridiales bacterium]|nr:hypothetical protein [Clostridiales bacterium]